MPDVVGLGPRGTKRQEIDCWMPPNTKRHKTNKGGKGLGRVSKKVAESVKAKGMTSYSGAAGELVAKWTNPCDQDRSDQQKDQEDFRRKFRDSLNDLRARPRTRERSFSGDEEPSEGTQKGPTDPGPKGL